MEKFISRTILLLVALVPNIGLADPQVKNFSTDEIAAQMCDGISEGELSNAECTAAIEKCHQKIEQRLKQTIQYYHYFQPLVFNVQTDGSYLTDAQVYHVIVSTNFIQQHNYLGINNKFEGYQSSFDSEYQTLKSGIQQACESKYTLKDTANKTLVANNQGKFDFPDSEPTQPNQPPPVGSAPNAESAPQQAPATETGNQTNSFIQVAGPQNDAQSAVSGGSCQLMISPASQVSLGQWFYWSIFLLPGIWSVLRRFFK